MITEEQARMLSKCLGIDFKFKSRKTTLNTLFSVDGRSYISYETITKKFEFLLVYDKVSFLFSTDSLDLNVIQQAMEKHTEAEYQRALNQSIFRKQICKRLKHSTSEI